MTNEQLILRNQYVIMKVMHSIADEDGRKILISSMKETEQLLDGNVDTSEQYEFPFHRTFEAISAAVKINSMSSLGISVHDFQTAFNSHGDKRKIRVIR